MTKESAMEKVKEMLNDANIAIIAESERLLSCGGIDVSGAEDNYHLPKLILQVAMENVSVNYRPAAWDKGANKELKNIRKF